MNVPLTVSVIGAGLAGCEAALVLARHGIAVTLYEMRPALMTPAHTGPLPAELVCSNSLKSEKPETAHGVLKAELSLLGSPLLAGAQACRIPAGSALAVDRGAFSLHIQKKISQSPEITYTIKEIAQPPGQDDYCIIAAGPLASESLTQWLMQTFSSQALHFYDAIAPIVDADSIDQKRVFYASRWNEEKADYCNCPFTEEEYRRFYEAVLSADKVTPRAFEDERYFESCLPVEVAAARDYKALTFGIMRPVGLTDPRAGRVPFAVCQLRRENKEGSSYNLVGFQTRMTVQEQKRVFRMIPGLEQAEFLRYGSVHRNTYLNSPQLLSQDLSFKMKPRLFLSGQISGSEGYTESIATGHLAALFVWAKIHDKTLSALPSTTACGALLKHITQLKEARFTPSNINFGLFDAIPVNKRIGRQNKRLLYSDRAVNDMKKWIDENNVQVFV